MSTRTVIKMALSAQLCLGGCRDFSERAALEPTRPASADGDAGVTRDGSAQGQFDRGEDAQASTESGATSDGGGRSSNGTAPLDWSGALDALYTFEDGSALGLDSSGHGRHLSVSGTVELSDEHAQGASSAHFEYAKGSGLWSNDVSFRTLAGTSFSAGLWLEASVTEGDYLAFFNGGQVQGGFSLAFGVGKGTVGCVIADGSGEYAYAGSGQISDFQDWTHVVCRYDHRARTTQLFVNGVPLVPAVETPAGIAQGSGRLSLGQRFDGQLDEAFFVHRALTDAQITRIWVCGVDGKNCACSEADSSTYAKCGPRADCEFATLPACDSELLLE